MTGLPFDAYAASRVLSYLALLLLIGAVSFYHITPARIADERGADLASRLIVLAQRIGLAAAAALALGAALRLDGQVHSVLDPGEPAAWARYRTMITATSWGRGWTVQAALAVTLVFAFWLAARAPRLGWSMVTCLALAAAIATPLVGHATEAGWGPFIAVPLHALHLLAAGAWLGTLAVLLLTVLIATRRAPAARGRALAALVEAFSPLALIAAAVLTLAGAGMSWSYVGSLGALSSTDYGRALSLKLIILSSTLLLGAWNWRRIRLRDPGVSGRLSRTAALELLLGAFLVTVTAVLVQLPAPRLAETHVSTSLPSATQP